MRHLSDAPVICTLLQNGGFFLLYSKPMRKLRLFNFYESKTVDWAANLLVLSSPKGSLQRGIHIMSKIYFKGRCQDICNHFKTHLCYSLLFIIIPSKHEAETYFLTDLYPSSGTHARQCSVSTWYGTEWYSMLQHTMDLKCMGLQ